jgi:hypothetical protein
MVLDRQSLQQMRSFVPLPPMSMEAAKNLTPEQLQALRNQRGQQLDATRKAYERIVGRPLADEDFENLLNDSSFQGQLSGRAEAEREKRSKQYYEAGKSAKARF